MEISLYHNQKITISVEELNEIKAKNRVLSRNLQKSINDYVDLLAVLKKERESNSDKAKKMGCVQQFTSLRCYRMPDKRLPKRTDEFLISFAIHTGMCCG